MTPTFLTRSAFALSLGAFATTAAALGQTVSVTLNGAPITLSPAPTERAGRVFVPLRGVFERLGASVVYANGTINAQGNNHSVSLQVGSTNATVNGQPQSLDVAPFIIGASTYVPLRFVSQALGASVNYDGANRIVALTTGPANAQPPVAAAPPQPQRSALEVRGLHPGNNEIVSARRPTIEAQFGNAQADPNSVRVFLDDLDVTSQASRSPVGFVYSPESDLQNIRHTVRVRGRDRNGSPFERSWSFTSGTSAVENRIFELSPQEGAEVGNRFSVVGRTAPGSRVVIQVGVASQGASARDVIGALLGVSGTGQAIRSEIIADPNGTFSTEVNIQAAPGSRLQLVVDSEAPNTKAAAPRVVRNLSVR